jgi:hypothetical protein
VTAPAKGPYSERMAPSGARARESLTVHIASAGREWLTELAVLSAVRHSAVPLDFVIGGSIGSEPKLLAGLMRRGNVRVEVAPGRVHAEWLDHWVRETHAKYAVFLDSDVFFRRTCWASPIVKELESGAALVSCDLWERKEGVIEPVRGAVTTAMPRPSPWVMAVDVARVRETGASFAYTNTVQEGEILAWDVGGKLLEALTRMGLVARSLPDSYGRYYTHIGGMSWRSAPTARIETKRWLRLHEARIRVLYERLLAARRSGRTAVPHPR